MPLNYRCEDADEPSPRVGCGCRSCYLTREASLDPRLLALAHERLFTSVTMSPARDLLYRQVMEYIVGRMDYGALYITIINSLVVLSDDTLLSQRMERAARSMPPVFVEEKPNDPS